MKGCEDSLIKSPKGLEERLAFLFPDPQEKSDVLNTMSIEIELKSY